jgi:hypothetical protein
MALGQAEPTGASLCGFEPTSSVTRGAAGSGKTARLILKPLRQVSWVANFTAVFFRRMTSQITNTGALIGRRSKFYSRIDRTPHLEVRE